MAKKALNIISTIVTVLAVCFAILAVFTVLTTQSGKAPEIAGYSAMCVVSGSMEPEIPVGALVLVKSCAPEQVSVGDVISFYSNDAAIRGQINTHRVTQIEVSTDGAYQFATKGDANDNEDAYPVYGDELIGRVVGVSTLLGGIIRLAGSKLGMFLIIVVPLLIIFIINARDVVKLFRQSIKEEEENIKNEEAAIRAELEEKIRAEVTEELKQEKH